MVARLVAADGLLMIELKSLRPDAEAPDAA